MEGKEDLRDAIGLCMALAEENPCRMKDMTMGTIAKALRALVSKEYTHGMNQRQLGKYLGVDARTIQRWAKKYPDFPKGRHDGDKEGSYRHGRRVYDLWLGGCHDLKHYRRHRTEAGG